MINCRHLLKLGEATLFPNHNENLKLFSGGKLVKAEYSLSLGEIDFLAIEISPVFILKIWDNQSNVGLVGYFDGESGTLHDGTIKIDFTIKMSAHAAVLTFKNQAD